MSEGHDNRSAVQRLADLDKEETVEHSQKTKNRHTAASTWVAHTMAVNDVVQKAVNNGLDPKTLTEAKITELLVASWEAKEAEKDAKIANVFGGLYSK